MHDITPLVDGMAHTIPTTFSLDFVYLCLHHPQTGFPFLKAWAVYPAGQLLQLADHELRARLENDLAAWQAAQQLENALPYDEPPSWYLPVANRFGEALQEAGRPKHVGYMLGVWFFKGKRWDFNGGKNMRQNARKKKKTIYCKSSVLTNYE